MLVHFAVTCVHGAAPSSLHVSLNLHACALYLPTSTYLGLCTLRSLVCMALHQQHVTWEYMHIAARHMYTVQ
jgi:hypothetical protein